MRYRSIIKRVRAWIFSTAGSRGRLCNQGAPPYHYRFIWVSVEPINWKPFTVWTPKRFTGQAQWGRQQESVWGTQGKTIISTKPSVVCLIALICIEERWVWKLGRSTAICFTGSNIGPKTWIFLLCHFIHPPSEGSLVPHIDLQFWPLGLL